MPDESHKRGQASARELVTPDLIGVGVLLLENDGLDDGVETTREVVKRLLLLAANEFCRDGRGCCGSW